jgi:TetR/AcrR family transcriptional regulator, mexJK operon transcriptional repressor
MPENQSDTSLFRLISELDLPRVPQQARSRQKRDALLVAAARLFEERGYEATTADDIAAAADVSIGTFYSYFHNKRQVFLTLYNDCMQSVFDLGIAELDFGANPQQSIRATVNRAMQRDRLFYGLRRVWSELLARDAEIAAYNERFHYLIYQQILTAVRRVAAQGLTWPQLDLESTSWLITMLIDRSWEHEPGPGESSEEEIERNHMALADLIFHAVFKS